MYEFTLRTDSESATLAMGERLATCLRIGDVIALDGELGVGKTRLAAGIAMACGAQRDDVTSPTFTLIHEYSTEPPVAHLDAYRLADSDEFLGLGVSELWEDGIVVVEWGSRVADALPKETLWVTGVNESGEDRSWTFRGSSTWEERLAAFPTNE